MYRFFIRPLLFLVDPEVIHHFTFSFLKFWCRVPGVRTILSWIYTYKHPKLEKTLFGVRFPNPVGLAAGMDKDARMIDEFSALGFGFIEIGTITPKAQPGNDKPRLFRLPADGALINRMGFNNKGAEHAAERLKDRRPGVVVGGNIGKNKVTPNEDAIKDYEMSFEVLYPYVDYFVVNVSSPNTPGLRDLQEKEPLKKLLTGMKTLSNTKERPKPVLLKIAPDLTMTQLDDIVEILRESGTDGVIATNTTISREGLKTPADVVSKIGAGGLSGKPVRERSTEVIAYLRAKMGQGYPIIGVGGIMNADDAMEKLKAGADLVQIYTGFIYEGPGFVKRILKKIKKSPM
jgi:dihydroorotate dehydrogenase